MAVAERNGSSIVIISRNCLFSLFLISTIFLLFSCFSVLRSTGFHHFVDTSSLTKSEPLTVIDNSRNNLQEEKEIIQKKDDAKCSKDNKLLLKVYMYDLSPEFHFGLLNWKPEGDSVWPDIKTNIPSYPGGLNLQHSIEYWLTLDLLASEVYDKREACSVIRVHNSSEADAIFVPFFSSLSYNRFSKRHPNETKSQNKVLQEKLVKFVTSQEEWKRSGGKDHIVMAHHPNSLLDARMQLWPAMFILSDFGRYPSNVANLEKDVIAPYKHVIKSYVNDASEFDSRPILLYFQGAIYRKDVSFLAI